MIISIDETGTFDISSNKLSLFVGIHLLEKKDATLLTEKLNNWKNKNRSIKNYKGEIKGSGISEELANEFVDEVLKDQRSLFITIVGTIPSSHSKKDIQFHRDHHLKTLRKGIEKCEEIGNHRLARQYNELANWYKGLNYQLLLKTWILGQMIGFSYRQHIIQTILNETDRTLGTIEILIDRDFVKEPQHIIYWKDLLRSWFYSYTYRKPIPILENWDDDHPFYMAKNNPKKENGSYVDKDNIFKDHCNFVESHLCEQVQVADILATIISEHLENGTYNDSYFKIKKYFIPVKGNPIRLLKMASEDEAVPDMTPNPWDLQNTINK